MKILDNNNYIKVTCKHCQSVLGIHCQDITYYEMAHHGSPFVATCAACGRNVDIPSSKVPRSWMAVLDPDPEG